jgi:hypothetical protein
MVSIEMPIEPLCQIPSIQGKDVTKPSSKTDFDCLIHDFKSLFALIL